MRRVIFAVVFFTSVSANAWSDLSDKEWTSGWGQGISEARVTNGKNNAVDVVCRDAESGDSWISVTIDGGGPNSGDVFVTFDKESPRRIHFDDDGRLSSASSPAFSELINGLRLSKTFNIRFADGRESRFTLKGSGKALEDCPVTLNAITITGEYEADFGYMTVKESRPNKYQVWLGIGHGSCGGEVLIENRTAALKNQQFVFSRPENGGTCLTTISFASNSARVHDTCINPEDEDGSTCALLGNYQKTN